MSIEIPLRADEMGFVPLTLMTDGPEMTGSCAFDWRLFIVQPLM